MKLAVSLFALFALNGNAAAGPVPGTQLQAEQLPTGEIRWSWTADPSAISYDLIGDSLPASDVAAAPCRTEEDDEIMDLLFDDSAIPLPGEGAYLLVGANYGSSWFPACVQPEAYFCVRDATGDSFVLRLDDQAKIDHARDVVRGIELERIHPATATMGGPISWNPGWQFHIPPEAVYFFDQALEICDASIAAVDQGGPPASTWCPWTSEIFIELWHPDQWVGGVPGPLYCGPALP